MIAEDVKVRERFKKYFEEEVNYEEEKGNCFSSRAEGKCLC